MTDIIPHLARLVSFPSISAETNLPILDHIEDIAREHGGICRRFPNPEGDKANLLMSFGPEVPGGLVLSGHTDVVPTTGQAWRADPFTLRIEGGRAIGRGACDMKGFLACCLAALPQITALPLARPLHLAFSYDEEVGCMGVVDMSDWLGANAAPALAIIGEPTLMRPVTAHKGGIGGWAHVRGRPGHSSQPDKGVNAVMIAAELIAEAGRIAASLREGPLDPAFDPPYSTLNVNMVEGGTATNILAEDCRFFWETRMLPGQDAGAVLAALKSKAEALLPAMRAVDPGCFIDWPIRADTPGLSASLSNAHAALLADLLGPFTPEAVSYGTEAGQFAKAGIPSVVLGPGTITQAHQPEESIGIGELEECTRFLVALARRMLV